MRFSFESMRGEFYLQFFFFQNWFCAQWKRLKNESFFEWKLQHFTSTPKNNIHSLNVVLWGDSTEMRWKTKLTPRWMPIVLAFVHCRVQNHQHTFTAHGKMLCSLSQTPDREGAFRSGFPGEKKNNTSSEGLSSVFIVVVVGLPWSASKRA